MRKHRRKFIAGLVIVAMLLGAWFVGSTQDVNSGSPLLQAESPVVPEEEVAHGPLAGYTPLSVVGYLDKPEPVLELEEPEEAPALQNTEEEPTPSPGAEEPELAAPAPTPSPEAPTAATPDPTPAAPAPTPPPGETIPMDTSFYVSLSVRVDTILNNMHLLCEEKHELVPASGVIFPVTQVRVEEGESVFEVLQREMRNAGIHMSSRFTPAFNSAYVEGIHNLFEFDVGPLSGWMYSVNGVFPNFGSSQYILSPGDVIAWVYTVDLGRDVGRGM